MTLICRDVDRLADFYNDLFNLEEIATSRSASYREFLTKSSKLGFAHEAAYAALNLDSRPSESPVSQLLSFEVGDRLQVDHLTQLAIERGARLVRPAAITSFDQYLSALLDPEANALRITAAA